MNCQLEAIIGWMDGRKGMDRCMIYKKGVSGKKEENRQKGVSLKRKEERGWWMCGWLGGDESIND